MPTFPLSLRLLCPAALWLVSFGAHAELAPAEVVIRDSVAQQVEPAIELLKTLVNQNSGTMNFEGVKAVADLLRPEFESLGFAVEWVPMREANRAGHLVATHEGKPGTTRMLLIGHLDTVFEPDSPFQTFERDEDMATGPGASDNKGGVAIMLTALKAMKAAGTLTDANIKVVLDGDEEDVGTPQAVARKTLIDAGRWADVALDFEDLSTQDGHDMGAIARRSSNSWTLTTTGVSAHSSGVFSERVGDGAIYELVRILARFRSELPEPSLTFNVGLIGGGQSADLDADQVRIAATGKTNIVASTAVARGDFRTLSQDQTDRVIAKMNAIVAEHAPKTGAEIDIEIGYPPMPPTDGNRALLERLNAINADLGLETMGELDPLRRGAGDIAFVASDTDGLVGLGMQGTGTHSPKESVVLTSIERQATRASILMSRLSSETYH